MPSLVDKKLRVVDISTKEKIRGYPLASPNIGEQELANIVDVVKSGWISSEVLIFLSLKKI